jgi:hypothetical protein
VHYTCVEATVRDAKDEHVRELGRNVGLVVFGVLVVAFTATCSIEICLQVWAPEVGPLTVGCAAGTLKLVDAIDAARVAAVDQPGEHAALARFRAVVAPAWTMRPALGRACARDPQALQHLHEVDRLRYAEEHAVRYGAVDLANRRQEVGRMIPSLRKAAQRTP